MWIRKCTVTVQSNCIGRRFCNRDNICGVCCCSRCQITDLQEFVIRHFLRELKYISINQLHHLYHLYDEILERQQIFNLYLTWFMSHWIKHYVTRRVSSVSNTDFFFKTKGRRMEDGGKSIREDGSLNFILIFSCFCSRKKV